MLTCTCAHTPAAACGPHLSRLLLDDEEMAKFVLSPRLGQLTHAHANTHVCVPQDDEEMAKILRKGAKALLDGEDDDEDSDDEFTDDEEVRSRSFNTDK